MNDPTSGHHARSLRTLAAIAMLSSALATSALAQLRETAMFYSRYFEQVSVDPPGEPFYRATTLRLLTQAEADLDEVTVQLPGPGGGGSVLSLEQFGVLHTVTRLAIDDATLLSDTPEGLYTFQGTGGTFGPLTAEMTRTNDIFWPDQPPAFSEATMNALQNVDVQSDLVLEFNTWDSPQPADQRLGFVVIYSFTSQQAVFFAFPGPTETSVVVPAGTLPEGSQLQLGLYFSSRQTLPTDPEAVSFIAFDDATLVNFSTPGGSNCPADFDTSGFVDQDDFVIFVQQYLIFDCTEPGMLEGCPCDLDGDALVDNADFLLFVAAYNDFLCP